MKQTRQITVLGIGNCLMEDDGIGIYVVEELKRRGIFSEFRLAVGETDTEYCLDEIEKADVVILIDATLMGEEPGTISVFALKEMIFRETSLSTGQHNFSLLHAMKVHFFEKDGFMLAVEAGSVTPRLGLSDELQKKFSAIVDKVIQLIEDNQSCYNDENHENAELGKDEA